MLVKDEIQKYYSELTIAMNKITSTDHSGNNVEITTAFGKTIDLILSNQKLGGKLYFIGNGASAAIASHQAIDYWKAAGIPSMCFNDAALLTCISNDYGYEHVFEKPVEMFLHQYDTLICISSSGNSENILRAFDAAKSKKASCITLTGFDANNQLRLKNGEWNYYVSSPFYGHVEVTHHSILHCILDTIIKLKQHGD